MPRFAVIFGFCTLFAGTQDITTSRGEHRDPNLILMSLKHPPLLPASRFSITPLNYGSKWAKNDKKSQTIRYKSVITQKSVVKISPKFLKNSPPCVTVSLPPSGSRGRASFMFYILLKLLIRCF